jgi:phospholipid/cholesterol/gamma-HCH transport system substrate-binding protein
MNVHLPTLREDLAQFAEVAKTYSTAAPDLVETLKNATTTARTLKDKEDEFGDLLAGVSGVADHGAALLRENEDALEVEGKLAVPLLKLLEFYSPEYPCVLKGLDLTIDGLNQIFRNSRVYQTMTFNGTQRPAFRKIDRPEWNWTWHGPWCLGLPDKAIVGRPAIEDGTEDNPLQHFRQGFR